jgi:hypothetical protein
VSYYLCIAYIRRRGGRATAIQQQQQQQLVAVAEVGSMAETAITTVLAKVAELVAWEAAVLLEVGDDVRLLRDKLEWLHTFIRDADRRRRRRDDEFVAVWVRQTRDVAFEAEDALDDFLHRAGRRRSRAGAGAAPGCGVVGWWPGCAGQVALRHDLYGRIRQIWKRLDEISANRAAYNIEHTPAPAWAASCSSATTLAAWYALSHNKNFTTQIRNFCGRQ